ncbi:S-layer homology domain-containing protein [Paenibacillus sp. GYB004]|uniref:S-layer homology domain-containing protein n=1 Tax=Paenibacillus sp. GYB004 TaxID=2994393 RepID=UPI002F966A8E
MKKPLTLASTALLALSLSATPVLAANTASPESSVTRGQFFKQVTDYLEMTPGSGSSVKLPSDITKDSPYASSVQALIERQIIDGYPDGTFRPDQPITKQEASYVLARFLGLEDNAALDQLKSKFGVSLEDQSVLLSSSTQEAIRLSLENDPKVVKWLEQSYAEQAKLKSYKMVMDQKVKVLLKEALPIPGDLQTSMKSEAAFDSAKGMHMTMKMEMPIPGTPAMDMEQYLVPEGTFMKIPDPDGTGSAKWVNMSKQMPFTFEQLMELQKNSASMNQAMMNKMFFYRDLGTETVGGKTMRKIGVNGKIGDMKQIMEALTKAMPDNSMFQSLPETPELQNMTMSMHGTMWINEMTMLTEKMDVAMKINYNSDSADIPLQGMDMSMAAQYTSFNEPVDIVLPAEAKNAEEFAIPDLTELPEAPAQPESGKTDEGKPETDKADAGQAAEAKQEPAAQPAD